MLVEMGEEMENKVVSPRQVEPLGEYSVSGVVVLDDDWILQ